MEDCVKDKLCLLTILGERFPELSKNSVKDLIKHGRVLIDGVLAKPISPLTSIDDLEVVPKKIFRDSYVIYYEDKHIIVIEKPDGLLSVSTDKETYHTLHSKVKRWHPKVWPVQRLDRETSGVVVFALTEEAKEGLKEQFITHTIYREYFAIVEGRLEGSGTWQTPLHEDKTFHVHIGREGDEVGITHFEALSRVGNTTRVKFVLETGKKNQIRVQSSHFGFPVVGDKKYGDPHTHSKRLMLHAHKLGFTHPVTKKELSFISPKPFI